VDADKVRLVELRYLMGCTVPEICELRGVSDATIERHLRFARAWLYDRLHSEAL
jgi:DNA-directed RNA polymerase specialized sigma24 family protein